jgi:hypothetical protein
LVRRALLWVAVLLAAASAVAADTSVEVRVDPPTFGVEDVARLIVKVYEPPEGLAVPELGALDNLEVVGGPSRGTEIRFINGVTSQAVTFTWLLRASAPGAASVGPISIAAGERRMEADAITVEVRPGSVSPPPRSRSVSPLDPFADLMGRPQAAREGRLALRLLVSTSAIVLGEPVVATVVLDSTVTSLDRFEWIELPSYPGWWAQRVEIPDQPTPEVIQWDGVSAVRYVVARSVLVPLTAGELSIPAAAARIGVRGRSLFSAPQVVERSTGDVAVTVGRRPSAPAGFAGAVGDLEYTATVEPAELEVGESAVVAVRLSGSGNLPLVEPLPTWPGCEGCEMWPPEESRDVTVDESGIRGWREWRVTVVPRRPGEIELAAVPVAVFDPRSGSYATASVGPFELTVHPPPATPTPTPLPGAEDDYGDDGSRAARPAPPGPPSWVYVLGALVLGMVAGGVVVALVGRRRRPQLPPARPGQPPSERARELQVALERWWLDVRDRSTADVVRGEVEDLRRELEAIRFAPGRADHSHTIEDVAARLRRVMRRA